MDYLILKLSDGDEIIGRVIELEEKMVKLDNPMRIVYHERPEGTIAGLTKYAYFVDQEIFEFDRRFIVQALYPREDFAMYYEDIVTTHYENTKNKEIASVEEAKTQTTEDMHEIFQAMVERSHISNTSIH